MAHPRGIAAGIAGRALVLDGPPADLRLRLRQVLAWRGSEFRELTAHHGLVHFLPHPARLSVLWRDVPGAASPVLAGATDCRDAGRGRLGAGREFELYHRALSRRHHFARLLRRYHRQFVVRHALHGAGLPAGAKAAGRRDRCARPGVRGRTIAAYSRQSDAEHHHAAASLRGDQAMAGWPADPVTRLAERAIPT